MKKLVIIGAGGMGRSVYCIALGCIGYDENFKMCIRDRVWSILTSIGDNT